MLLGFFFFERCKRNKVKRTIMNYLIFSSIIFLSVLMSSCNNPIKPDKDDVIVWENITGNLSGKRFKSQIKVFNGKLYVLADIVYTFDEINNEWLPVGPNTADVSNKLVDFVVKEDSLFVLRGDGEVYYLKDGMQWVKMYDANGPDFLPPANCIAVYKGNLYAGLDAQHVYPGLVRLDRDSSKNRYFKFNMQYTVDRMYVHDGWLYVGTTWASSYFIARCDGDSLYALTRKFDGPSCFSFESSGDTLFVGADYGVKFVTPDGSIKDYQIPIPPAPGFSEEYAFAILKLDERLLVGTVFSGIVEWDDKEKKWVPFFTEGLPKLEERNGIYFWLIRSLVYFNGYIYAAVSTSWNNYTRIYRLNYDKLKQKLNGGSP